MRCCLRCFCVRDLPVSLDHHSEIESASSKSFVIETFGCRVNMADSQNMRDGLQKSGHQNWTRARALADPKGEKNESSKAHPDAIVVNTCTVTENADKQVRQWIRKMKRRHPSSEVVVTGCYAHSGASRLKEMKDQGWVDHVVPIAKQQRLPQVLDWTADTESNAKSIAPMASHTRVNLKVQNGCNAYCSFCILPYVRGRSESIDLSNIKTKLQEFVDRGHQEIVLTGTHIGAYGRDLSPRLKFSNLLDELTHAQPEVRFRVSSLEPATLSKDVIASIRQAKNIQAHFHIPMQSGSAKVLKAMNRKCPPHLFERRILDLRSCFDRVSIGTDVIVGFPSEGDQEFEETLAMVETLPLTYVHVFPFSPRPGTRAAKLSESMVMANAQTKKRRVQKLRDLGRKKKLAFYQEHLGETHDVIVERRRDEKDRLCAMTQTYLPVRFEGDDRLMGRRIECTMRHVEKDDEQHQDLVLASVV